MIYLLYTIHVLVCLFLILVVLLQQGKGADLSVFGGGATQAAFGARGAVSLLHKLTVWGFVAFIATTISIGFMTSAAKTSSVLSGVPATEAEAPETEAPEGELPAGVPQETAPAAAEDAGDETTAEPSEAEAALEEAIEGATEGSEDASPDEGDGDTDGPGSSG